MGGRGGWSRRGQAQEKRGGGGGGGGRKEGRKQDSQCTVAGEIERNLQHFLIFCNRNGTKRREPLQKGVGSGRFIVGSGREVGGSEIVLY